MGRLSRLTPIKLHRRRRVGCIEFKALLLSPNASFTRRSHRKAPQLSSAGKMREMLILLLNITFWGIKIVIFLNFFDNFFAHF